MLPHIDSSSYSVAVAQWIDVEERERLLAIPDLHRGDLSCVLSIVFSRLSLSDSPLMILQKTHAADMMNCYLSVSLIGSVRKCLPETTSCERSAREVRGDVVLPETASDVWWGVTRASGNFQGTPQRRPGDRCV